MNIIMGPLILEDCVLKSTIKDLDNSHECVKVILKKGRRGTLQELAEIEVSNKKKTLIFDKTPHDGRYYSLSLAVKYDGQTVYGPTEPIEIKMCGE